MINRYMGQGLKRDTALSITNISKHQFYYQPVGKQKAGKAPSTHTLRGNVEVDNEQVVALMKQNQPAHTG